MVVVSAGLALIQNNCHATGQFISLLVLLVFPNARPRTETCVGAVWDRTGPNLSKDLQPSKDSLDSQGRRTGIV